MALETGNFISALVRTNPLSSDNISEGDDHLQLIKKILQKTFPVGTDSALDSGIGPDQAVQVLIAKSSAPTVDTSASGNAARAMGLLWLDTSNNLLKIRNQANDAWVTLSVDPENDKTVDIEGGTIDGTIIGGSTPAAGDFTTLDTTGALTVGTDITISGDDIIMATNTNAYMLVADGTSYNPVAITGDITLTNAGVTSIGADKIVTVKILDANVTNAKLANMAANTVKVRDANSSGVPSDKSLATTEILIGDGTGFTAAALSGDATMTNAGAVTVTKIQGEAVSSTSVANDQYLKYSSSASEWQKVNVVGDDKLTTKGDLLVYNTVDSETRLPVGTNDYVLAADSSATNGLDWQQLATAGIADNAVTLGKLEDGTQGDILYYGASGAPTRLGFGTSGDVLTTAGTGANPAWATPTTGDITSVVAGSGLTGGATSGAATLTVGAGTGITVNTSDVALTNTAVSYGGISVALGASDATPAFDLSDATAYTGDSSLVTTGTIASGTWNGTAVALAYIGSGVGKLATDASWTGSQRATAVTDNDMSYDMDLGQNFISTPSGDSTLTFTNITDGQSGFLKLINSGGHTISLHGNSKGDANLATTVTTAGTYLLSYFSDGTDVWLTNSAIYA